MVAFGSCWEMPSDLPPIGTAVLEADSAVASAEVEEDLAEVSVEAALVAVDPGVVGKRFIYEKESELNGIAKLQLGRPLKGSPRGQSHIRIRPWGLPHGRFQRHGKALDN